MNEIIIPRNQDIKEDFRRLIIQMKLTIRQNISIKTSWLLILLQTILLKVAKGLDYNKEWNFTPNVSKIDQL